MRLRHAIMLLVACTFCCMCTDLHASSSRWPELQRTPEPKFQQPHVREVRLPNGITCFLLEDHLLPAVTVEAVLRGGLAYDPLGKVGLTQLAGIALKNGGTTSFAPEAFEQHLDSLGSTIGVVVNRDVIGASLQTLSSALEPSLHLFMEMIFQPRFDAKRLELAREQLRESLRRQQDNPNQVANIAFAQLVYGAHSPWAWQPQVEKIASLSDDDVKALHARVFRPKNLILAISGDFDPNLIIAQLTKLTSGLSNQPAELPTLPRVEEQFIPEQKLIPRNFTQAFIRMGHLGIHRHNPDKYAVIIMNYILGGGGFQSRLMQDIRTRRGLAYGILSTFEPQDDLGLFQISVATKRDSEAEVLRLIREHVARMHLGEDISAAEVQHAKNTILNGWLLDFANPQKVVSQRALFRLRGYPDNYHAIFRNEIRSVGREHVRAAAKKYLHPDALDTVVLGPIQKGL